MEIIKVPGLEGCDYPVGNDIKVALKNVKKLIKEWNKVNYLKEGNRVIYIVCTGSSGAILAALFAANIKNENKVVHIKKSGENAHHNNYNILIKKGNLVVFIDDFIQEGESMNRMWNIVKEFGVSVDAVLICGYEKASLLDFTPKYFFCIE